MSTSRTSSTPASSLRPRVPRLISGLSDTDEEAAIQTSPPPSPTHLRHRPAAHPSREPAERTRIASVPAPVGAKDNAVSLASLWGSSWTAFQGIANDFLGEQNAEPRAPRVRRSSKADANKLFVKPRTDSWGPKQAPTSTPASYIATGSSAEREALVRAQKRKAMLSGAAASYTDASGKFKRRTSEEGISSSAPPGALDDRDALIYLHYVKPEDTMAGITIRYSCQANILRKANRMWPNDTVQVRKILVLPVEACGVKGRPISAQQAELMNDPERDESDLPTPKPNGISSHHRTESNTSNTSHSSATDSEPPWTHDSWVVFPSSSHPTEIVRLSRRALGYFPPARRKSLTYSDLDSPSTSLDISRSSYFESLSSSAGANQSPLRQGASQRPGRTRRTSNAANGYFPSYLAGPGGVGTMAKNVKAPGPAQDGLNRLFASKLPNVAPPPHQQNLYMPEMPLYKDSPSGTNSPYSQYPHGGGSGFSTPTGQGLNLELMGAAVEGWIRKMAVRAQKGLEGTDGASSGPSKGPPGLGGPSGIGDLIEMADQFELGSDEDRNTPSDARGRQTQGSGTSFSSANAKNRNRGTGKSAKAD